MADPNYPSSEGPTSAQSPGAAGTPPEDGVNPGTHHLLPRAPAISWWMLLITTLAILMTSVDHQILPAVLPQVSEQYNLTPDQAGLINSVYFAGLVVGGIAFGYISDRIGTGYRRTWTWNIAMLFAVIGGALTFGLAGSFIAFLLLRIPMGISRGGSEPVNVAIVSEWWPKEHRGFAVGVHHTGFPIGQFLAGALIAIVLGSAHWSAAFLVIPLLGIPIIIGQTILGRKRHQATLYRKIEEMKQTPPLEELSAKSTGGIWGPVKEALRHANVRWAVLLCFLFLYGEAGVVTFLTLHFRELGMDVADAILVSGASGLTGWIGQVVWGTLSDRLGRKFSIAFLIGGYVLSMLAMLLIVDLTTAWLVLLFWGLFRNAPFPVVYALLVDSVPRAAGTAMGIMIGVALGVSGIVASAVSGVIITQLGFTWHYVVLAGICLIGFIPLARITETVQVARRGRGGPDAPVPA